MFGGFEYVKWVLVVLDVDLFVWDSMSGSLSVFLPSSCSCALSFYLLVSVHSLWSRFGQSLPCRQGFYECIWAYEHAPRGYTSLSIVSAA